MRAFIVIILLLLVSCEEAIEWESEKIITHELVVESIITNEFKNQHVKLTQPKLLLNEEVIPISDAIVSFYDGETIYETTEYPTGTGNYYSNESFAVVINKMYYLYIQYNGNEYYAGDYLVPTTPIRPLFLWKDENDFYSISYTTSDLPSMLEVYLDWSHFDRTDTLYDGTGKAKQLFYTLNTIDVAQMFKPDKENILFPKGTVIVRKKYSLSPPHQEFIRSYLSETEWRGGYFDVLPGNTVTNLSEGALGFFGVCAVSIDTAYASDAYLK